MIKIAATMVLAGLLMGCSSPSGAPARTSAPVVTTAAPAASRCTIAEAERYDDLRACRSEPIQIELEIAESMQGKTTSKIAIASRDSDDILAAMGAWAVEWSIGADSFTVFAYGSEEDADLGGYNRGRMFWNDRGPIAVDVCTEYTTLDDGGDFCEDQVTLTLENE